MLLQRLLENSARRLPEKTALVSAGSRWSYAEINRRANLLARDLQQQGIVRGDRVAVFLDDPVDTVLSVFAILKAGGIFALIGPGTKAEKLRFMLEKCGARGILTDAPRWPLAASLKIPGLHMWLAGEEPLGDPEMRLPRIWATPGPDTAPPNPSIDQDLAAIVFTSGTSGRPKGAMLTHANMRATAASIVTYLENTESDVLLNVLPLAFGYGLYQILTAFQVGATVILEKMPAYPQPVLETMRQEQVTGFAMVPTIAAVLLSLDLRPCLPPSLRYLTNAGAAIPVEHLRKFRAAWPGVRFYSMYGLTECQRASYLPPEEADERPGSVGRGMPNCEVFLVDETGRRVPPGGSGELVVRGANVMQGYWDDPEETARTLRPGVHPWERLLYTGDLFRSDADGYLYFLGRRDEMIKTRGEKVSPKEVEDVLHRLEGVAQCAVVGVPHPVLGQAVRAVIYPQPGSSLTRQQVLEHCQQHLEPFMVPRFVEFRSDLPTNESGKVVRRALLEPNPPIGD